MVLGSVLILNPEIGKSRIAPKDVSIRGCLRGFIADVTVRQTFQQDTDETVEMSYIVPNNSKICIYDTTFYVGDEVIKPKIEEKKHAEEIYRDAQEQDFAAIMARSIGNGLIEFTLGNIACGVSVCVEVKCCFIGSRSGVNGMVFKFPLDVCTQMGRTQCIMKDMSGSFAFELDCSSRKPDIVDVSSNSPGTYDKETCKFSLSSPHNLSAVLVTVNFGESLKDEFFVGGQFMGLSVFGREFKEFSSKQNNEFVFVVDCSGSMMGRRIESARRCLDLFLRSLPVACYFNIYRFGSEFHKLFAESVVYDDDTFRQAVTLANELNADLGGTELYPVLQEIFSVEQKGVGSRQIFVLTDGEIGNTDAVLYCARQHCEKNRIFTLGIGDGADAGLVEGLASASGGRCDFVIDSDDDFTGKVIPQLEASFSCAISNVSIHIEGHDDVVFSETPLCPISVDGETHVIVKSSKHFTGDETVLVNGCYGDENVDIAVSGSQSFSKDDPSLGKVLEVLFNYNVLRGLCRRMNSAESTESLKEQIIMLSKASGLLCPFTSFVGCSTQRYRTQRESLHRPITGDLQDVEARLKAAMASCCSQRLIFMSAGSEISLQCSGGTSLAKGFGAAAPEKEPAKQQFTFHSVTVLQNLRGYWDDISTLLSETGKQGIEVPSDISSISGIAADDKSRAFNTVFAIAVLRHLFMSSHSSWKLVEKKAISWLSSLSSGVNWELLIEEVSSKL